MSSINEACGRWSQAKAAYRFFENPHLTPERLLEPHEQQTLKRIQQWRQQQPPGVLRPAGPPLRVLGVQDTTFLNFNGLLEAEGLGPIGTRKGLGSRQSRGVILHTLLAVAPEGSGLPLGILWQKQWARQQEESSRHRGEARRKQLHQIPLEERESFKWVQGIRAGQQSIQELGQGIELIQVCDREADIGEFLYHCCLQKASYVVRANFDRSLDVELHPRMPGQKSQKLSDWMRFQPVEGEFELELEAISRTRKQEGRKKRRARLQVRFSHVKLHASAQFQDRGQAEEAFFVFAVDVQEVDAPEGVQPLHWTLLTDLPVTTWEEALEKIRWYQMRWHIELFHKVLKSGCQVEDCELEGAENRANYLTLMSIIAWRLYWMSRINREQPDTLASTFLSAEEWSLLYRLHHRTRKKPPDHKPPTAREAVRWIAMLGGFLGRKGDGQPGIVTLWRGWRILCQAMEVARVLQAA